MRKLMCHMVTTALLFSSTTAHALDNRVVTDRDGDPVRNSFGRCVLTEWVTSENICNEAEVAQIAPSAGPVNHLVNTVLVYFNFDKFNLTPAARETLTDLGKAIRNGGGVLNGTIEGHADEIGTNEYNMNLSRERATTVRQYLDAQGFDMNNVEIQARGENDQVKDCDDNMERSARIDCLAPNRRAKVSLKLNDTDTM